MTVRRVKRTGDARPEARSKAAARLADRPFKKYDAVIADGNEAIVREVFYDVEQPYCVVDFVYGDNGVSVPVAEISHRTLEQNLSEMSLEKARRLIETREVESDHPVAVAPKAREQEEQDSGGQFRAEFPSADRFGSLISITFPSQSFAPIKYGSFVVPSVALTCTIPKGSSDAEVLALKATMILELKALQDELFEKELVTYLERAKRVYKVAAQSVGE